MKKKILCAYLLSSFFIYAHAQFFNAAIFQQPNKLLLVAGTGGGEGCIDGSGENARLRRPTGMAFDSGGNLYISCDNAIMKVTPNGEVRTIAGVAELEGAADGFGKLARFSKPRGLAVDSKGNIFVSDTGNYTIRKISPTGEVTTFAGKARMNGIVDGSGEDARFGNLWSMAIDSKDNLYVTEYAYHVIRKITPQGMVSTLAGLVGMAGNTDGTGSDARFRSPYGIAVDSNDSIYVADSSNHSIRKITQTAEVTTFAGRSGTSGTANGVGNLARFNSPDGLAIDSIGNIYVADSMNHAVRKISDSGVVTTLAGMAGTLGNQNGIGNLARFNQPRTIAVYGNGPLHISDNNNILRKVTESGSVSSFLGRATEQGSVDGASTDARFNRPYGMAIDKDNNLFVVDSNNHTIRKITSTGGVTTFAGLAGSFGQVDGVGDAARFNSPRDIEIDAFGNLYVADYRGQTIRKITPAGEVSTFAGVAGSTGNVDGPKGEAKFNNPAGLAFDNHGNLYVTDFSGHTIRKISSDGNVTTLAGNGIGGSTNGTGATARFFQPSSITVDSAGDIYVVDENNALIRKITPTGVVTTVLTGTTYNKYYGVAAGDGGDLYITQGNVLLKSSLSPSGNRTVRTIVGDGQCGSAPDSFLPAQICGSIRVMVKKGKVYFTTVDSIWRFDIP